MTQQQPPAPAERSQGGFAFVATRPVAITMFILALGVFGVVSFKRLPVDLLPEISYPTLTVRTGYPGAAPEDVEDRISVRVQEALSTLPGLVRSTSISRAAFSDVLVEFNWGTQMTFAVQEVRDRLDAIFLPAGAERPLILRYDPNLDPILRIGVSPITDDASDAAFVQTRWIAENKIKRELESIEGVAAVNVRGGLEEEILVSVDPYRLDAQNIPASAIGDRLSQENLNASGGQIREGSTDYLVRTLNEFQTIDEIRNLAVLRREGATIRISDLATVTRTHAEREVITRVDGAEAVEIAIYREAGANIVDVAQRVRERLFGNEEDQKKAREQGTDREDAGVTWMDRQSLGFLTWTLRKEARIELLSDQSTFIGAAIDDVKWAALFGGALAIAVMWIFLRKLSATLIIGLAIPISVLVTFAPMFLSNVSLNIMSLGGLALGIGMLVDNAIVVLESITRCREEGDPLGAAAVRGVGEVSGAITASTLTTVAVFAPIVFVEGIAGQIFGDQALTVVSSLLVSLLVAVLFIPMLASRTWLDSGGEKRQLFHRVKRDKDQHVSFGRWALGFLHEFFLHDIQWSWGSFIPNLVQVLVGRTLLFVAFIALRLLSLISALLFFLGSILTWPVRKLFDALWRALDVAYPRMLAISLRHPFLILLTVAAGSWFAVRRAGSLGLELIPEIHQAEFTAHVGLSVGTPILVSDRIFAELDREIRALEAVKVTAMTVGVEQESLTRKIEGDHTARITVRLKPEFASLNDEERAVERVRSMLQSHPEVRSVDVTRPTPFAIDSPLAVEVRGHDLAVLGEIADQVRERMAGIDGLTDVRTTMRPGHPEARITFDRDKTLEYGLDLGAVSDFVRDSV
ncbi:MAG: HAE1 family hydrophobic/amphiphilic exporter-1, partial [Planctomycetota bacterium]